MVDFSVIFDLLELADKSINSKEHQQLPEQDLAQVEFPVSDGDEEDIRLIESIIFIDKGEKYEYFFPKNITPSGDTVTLWFESGEDSPTDLYWDNAPNISVNAEVLIKLEDGELVPGKSKQRN